MSAHVVWFGHSTFQIETSQHRILLDPFFSGNPAASCTADDLNPDVIIVSHGHGDHVGDTVEIARRTGALVIANYEITEWLRGQGISNLHAQNTGGAFRHPFGTVKLTIAHHSSMLPDGANGGNPCGVLLKLADATIYYAADTALFSEMQFIGDEGIDLAILPIGDNYTMGPNDALKAVSLIRPRQVIPAHYDTWPLIAQDANAWAERVQSETTAQPVLLSVGDRYELV